MVAMVSLYRGLVSVVWRSQQGVVAVVGRARELGRLGRVDWGVGGVTLAGEGGEQVVGPG